MPFPLEFIPLPFNGLSNGEGLTGDIELGLNIADVDERFQGFDDEVSLDAEIAKIFSMNQREFIRFCLPALAPKNSLNSLSIVLLVVDLALDPFEVFPTPHGSAALIERPVPLLFEAVSVHGLAFALIGIVTLFVCHGSLITVVAELLPFVSLDHGSSKR